MDIRFIPVLLLAYPKGLLKEGMDNPMLTQTSQILNMYLYGQNATPADLLQNNWANRADGTPENYVMDVGQFMTTGAGRFATGSQSALVQAFFDTSIAIAPGTYTKAALGTSLGIASYGINLQAYNFADGTNDVAERTLIFNSQAFELDPNVSFTVAADGTRTIENYRIIPRHDVQENFDFVSDDWLAGAFNSFLETRIDPSSIGEVVNINFGGNFAPTKTYTFSDYQADVANVNTWHTNAPGVLNLASLVGSTLDEAFGAGITSFLYEGKPVVYGTKGNDVLVMPTDPYWHDYLANGVVMIAGDGNDVLNGSETDDLFIGGDGADIHNGGGGIDTVSYRDSAAVKINLADLTQNTGDAKDDVYNDISIFEGSKHEDEFVGVRGNADRFSGLAGSDKFLLDDRLDTVTGGADADMFKVQSYIGNPVDGFDANYHYEFFGDLDLADIDLTNFSKITDFNPAEGDKLDFSQFFDFAEAHFSQPNGAYQAVVDLMVGGLKLGWSSGNDATVYFMISDYQPDPTVKNETWYAGVVLKDFNASNLTGDMFIV